MRPRHMLAVVAALALAVVAAGSVGPAGAQTGDPVVFDVTPPTQTTAPGTQVDITFTVSDVPPCDDGNIVTLDSLDFTIAAPTVMSTIAAFSDSEPPGSVSAVFSPDMTSLSLLFDEGFPCEDSPGPRPGTTETITVVVTLDVPAGVPSGTQLTLTGDARGFADPPGDDYLLQRTATVLVEDPPPPPPPPGPGDAPDSGHGSGSGAPGGVAGTVPGGTPSAVAATALQATVRFTG